MLLGALMKGLDKKKLLSPRPAKPFLGLSIVNIREALQSLSSLNWAHPNKYGPHTSSRDCRLEAHIEPILAQISVRLADFTPPVLLHERLDPLRVYPERTLPQVISGFPLDPKKAKE